MTSINKKALLFVVLTLVLMFAMVATAYAAATSDYVAASADNPHTGYATTTVKCGVCHAVHKGTSTGQILLRSTVGDACTYCHIANNVGATVLYGGTGSNFYGGGDIKTAHNNGGGTVNGNAACTNCHGVHGANCIGGTVAGKILKTGTYQARIVANVGFDIGTGSRDVQVSMFCTECHPYFVDDYEQTVKGSLGEANAASDFKSHIMKASGSTYGNTNRTIGNVIVAFGDSTYCRSCHDAGLVDQGVGVVANSFPHYTPGAERFLLEAASSSGYTFASGTTAGSGAAAANANDDGVCLKCHYDGTDGVNHTF